MRSYAVIPPALLDAKTRSRRFKNTNGLMEDPMQEYKDKQFLNLWTDQEKEMFKVCFVISILLSPFDFFSASFVHVTNVKANGAEYRLKIDVL